MNTRNLVSIVYYIIWICFFGYFAFSFAGSFLAFFALFAQAKEDTHFYPAAFGELCRALLSGWLLLALFQPPGSRTLVPPQWIREHPVALFRLFYYSFLVLIWRIVILNVTYGVSALPITSPVSGWLLYVLTLLAVTMSALGIYAVYRGKRSRVPAEPDGATLSIEAAALKKLEKRLTQKERNELELMLYQNNALEQFNINSIALLFACSLLSSLLIAVIQDLFSRQ